MTTPSPITERSPKRKATRKQHSRLLIWLVLLNTVIVCGIIAASVLRSRARAGQGMPPYSVYSDGPDGLATTADVLRNLGWQPVAVTRPIQQTHHRGLLLLVEPRRAALQLVPAPELSDADVAGLLDWVSRGNTLLLCGLRNTGLHEKLGVKITPPDGEAADVIYEASPGAAGAYTARIDRLALESKATVSGRGIVPLWWFGTQPAAALVQHGAGRVLIVPDASLLTHRGLLRDDNVLFLYNVAALDAVDGRVYFDEYHHGIRSGGGYWGYLRFRDQHWVLLHLALLAGLAAWATGRRLGPAAPLQPRAQTDGVDFASSVARIYEKADARPLIAGVLARHFLDAVTAHLRLRRLATPQVIMAAWRQRYGQEFAQQLADLLRWAEVLGAGPDHTPAAPNLMATAKAFDAFAGRLRLGGGALTRSKRQ
jgi:hypothetical protein